jgi:hypothetical protein
LKGWANAQPFIFSTTMSPLQKIFRDPSFWTLIALNLFFIYEVKDDPKQYTTVIWLYWLQSVLIGLFNFIDMLTLKTKNIDVSNMTFNDKPATPAGAKGCLPIFFLFHYGIFHFVYLIFLFVDFKITDTNFSYLGMAALVVFLQQVIQFVQNKVKFANRSRNIASMFFTPYLRIVPMHLTILLPKFLGWTPGLTFLILKTVFDVIGYLVTTKYYRNNEQRPEPGEGYI